MQRSTFRMVMIVVGWALAAADISLAQSESAFGPMFDPTTNNTPRQSVVSTAARAPGVMVDLGLARTLVRTQRAQSTIEISEQLEPDPIEDFVDEAKDVILEQVTEFFFYITNLILERAGLPPIEIPTLPIVDDDDVTGRPDKPGTR